MPSPIAMSATVVTVRGDARSTARPQIATAVRCEASTTESTISTTAPSTATIEPDHAALDLHDRERVEHDQARAVGAARHPVGVRA